MNICSANHFSVDLCMYCSWTLYCVITV